MNVGILEEGDYKTAIEGALSKEDRIVKYPLSLLQDGIEVALKAGEEK